MDVERVGFTTCDGYPGGNIEDMHTHLGTWETPERQQRIAPTLSDEATRATYD